MQYIIFYIIKIWNYTFLLFAKDLTWLYMIYALKYCIKNYNVNFYEFLCILKIIFVIHTFVLLFNIYLTVSIFMITFAHNCTFFCSLFIIWPVFIIYYYGAKFVIQIYFGRNRFKMSCYAKVCLQITCMGITDCLARKKGKYFQHIISESL